MKKQILKTSSSFLLLFVASIAFASNEINPKVFNSNIELKVINQTTIAIKTNLPFSTSATYEIQRSYDNKTFRAVAMYFGNEEGFSKQPFTIKDKIKPTTKKVYYRVIKVKQEGGATLVVTSHISI